jgi:hypothetical protein
MSLADELSTRISAHLAPNHLVVRGWFRIETGDLAEGADAALAGAPALLVGNHGGGMWNAFVRSAEFRDDLADPLDAWTRRMIARAARGLNGVPLFPFGKPIWPFQRWAKRAMGIEASPLGILIHPQFGLWHALRGAIAFPGIELDIADVRATNHACDECREKPCLSACPVSAFSPGAFAAKACRGYLDALTASSNESRPAGAPDCMENGCAARDACPVGREFRYGSEQLRFHMWAFRGR